MSSEPSASPQNDADIISTFRAVTALENDNDARRILQLYAWNLDHAVTAYLDNPSILNDATAASASQPNHHQPSPPPQQPPPPSSVAMAAAAAAAADMQAQSQSNTRSQSTQQQTETSTSTALQAPNGQAAAPAFVRLPRWLFMVFSPIRFVWSFLSNITTKIIHLLSGPAFLIESAPGNTPTRRFVNFYESRYGNTHPDFHDGSYASALSAAGAQLKFMLVYIHSESHRLTPTFCQDVLSDPSFIAATNGSFVTWAGSITQREAAAAYHSLRAPALPFMAIVAPSTPSTASTTTAPTPNGNAYSQQPHEFARSQHGTLLSIRAGPTLVSGGATSAINWLTRVMQRHTQMIEALRQQRIDRESARLLRQQQDEEFARSLEADRRREREAELAREREQEEQKRLAELEVRRERKRQALGEEPEKGPGVASVVVRLPDGQRVGRRFNQEEALEQVFDWAEVNGVDIEKACLVMSFPRKMFKYPEDAELKIRDAGLFPSAMLLLEERVEE